MSRQKFPAYFSSSGWNEMLHPRRPGAPFAGTIRAPYVVIGAGFTGVAIARRLAELDPQARILLIEAGSVGEGPSGRNSGFTRRIDAPEGADPASLAQGEALGRYSAEGFDTLRRLVEEHAIDCHLSRCGTHRAAATARGAQALRAHAKVLDAAGVEYRMLDRAALAGRIGSAYYGIGLYTPDAWQVQPAALIRGLVDTLPSNVTLYENSPVRRLAREENGWRLILDAGEVTAGKLFLATNAFVKSFGFERARVVKIFTYAGVTEALPEAERPALGSLSEWGVLPMHRLGSTLRRIGPDRVMVRSLYAYEADLPEERVRAELTSRLHRRWPELAHRGFEYLWGGSTALTMNGSPVWGEKAPGLYLSAGCNGAGISKGTVLGTHLAELALGHGDHRGLIAAYGVANLVAPEPFRTIGFHAVSAIERRRAGLES